MRVAKYLLTVLTSTAVLAACQDDTTPESFSEEDVESTEENSNIDMRSEDNQSSEETESTEESATDNEEGTINDTESPEAIEETDIESLNRVIDKADDIESYEATVDLEATTATEETAELNAEVSFIDGDPPSLYLTSDGEDRTISKDGNFYFFTGEEWVNATESVSIDSLFFVTYENTVRSLANIEDSLEVEEEGDTTTYTYEGTNPDVYYTFGDLFKVSFGSVDTSQVESELTIEVDNEEELIDSIEFSADGENEEGPFSLNGFTEFTSFNDVEEINLPEEAIE